ncbi:MAG TPA: hypothetical protein VFL61_06120 [Gaiellaceae bacterium]|nr:hypothetical protein [Gaiellaceae bacterium]
MARVLAIGALVLALVPAGAAAEQSAAGKAKLRVLSTAPLKVKGTGFHAHERVAVRVTGRGGVTRKRVSASSRGGWVLAFPGITYDRCNGLVVSAVGSRGSRTGLKLPQPLCPPPL